MKHDIYVQEMLDTHRQILEGSFGPGLVDLRERLKSFEAIQDLIQRS